VLHLTAYQPDRRVGSPQVIERPPAVANVRVSLREPRTPAAVCLEPGRVPVTPARDGEWLRLMVPPFTIHTAVVFQWA
jgi:hypothetical protein